MEALLNSGATELVISKEFAKKYEFRRIKLERLIYMRNMDSILNYTGPIVDIVEVEIFFKGHNVKIVDNRLDFYFSLVISFYFSFLLFLFFFSIFRTTWVRIDRSRCHISHNLMA